MCDGPKDSILVHTLQDQLFDSDLYDVLEILKIDMETLFEPKIKDTTLLELLTEK